jgi:hypothetical protein
MAGFGRGAFHGPFEHAQDELTQQRLVADAQGMKIVLHLAIRGVPFL